MRTMVLATGVAFAFLAACGIAGAEELGRVDLNGRSIVLDSGGTWTYADGSGPQSSVTSCADDQMVESKKLPVSLCLQSGWRMLPDPAESMEFEAIQTDKDIYFGLITERTKMEEPAIREAILYNAASASGVKASDVPVVVEEKRSFAGQSWNYIVYDVDFKGAPFRFANYYRALGDKGAVQLVFWSSKGYFDEDKVFEEAVASTLVLKQ